MTREPDIRRVYNESNIGGSLENLTLCVEGVTVGYYERQCSRLRKDRLWCTQHGKSDTAEIRDLQRRRAPVIRWVSGREAVIAALRETPDRCFVSVASRKGGQPGSFPVGLDCALGIAQSTGHVRAKLGWSGPIRDLTAFTTVWIV